MQNITFIVVKTGGYKYNLYFASNFLLFIMYVLVSWNKKKKQIQREKSIQFINRFNIFFYCGNYLHGDIFVTSD